MWTQGEEWAGVFTEWGHSAIRWTQSLITSSRKQSFDIDSHEFGTAHADKEKI